METNALEELKAHLMATDEQFRRLSEQHAEYKKRVEVLESKHALSEDEQIEETRLKKLKLHLKDQMLEIASRHKAQHVA
jgi:uncharacterized protein YdcH (DUF465 family)